MAIEGSLTDVSLADICQLLSMGRKSGCLSMTDKSNFGQIFFEDGRVIYSSLINRPDRLGELLVKNGAITADALTAAMSQQAEQEGRLLGELLVSAGAISQDELDKYISVQIQEAVYHLFTWNTGTFQFQGDVAPDEGLFLISTSADALLMEGARRVDEWSLMEKKISSMDLIFALDRNPLEEEGVELSEHQRRIIPLLNGERTVTELVDDSGLVEFDTGKALYGLIQGGFASQVGRRAASEGGGGSAEEHRSLGLAFYRSGMLEDAVRELKLALQIDPKDPGARKYLGMISLRNGRPREAIVHFDEMADSAEATYPLLRNRAFAYERMNRFQDSLSTLAKAEQMNPNDPNLVLARAIVLLKSGEGLDALKAFQSYRGRLGNNTPSAVFYAYSVLAAGMAGDLDRAIEIGREGLGHYPNEGAILVNTGGVIAHRGEAAAARSFFQRAIDEGGNPPEAHKAMGDQALKESDKARAKECYEAAIKLNPRLGEDVYIKLGAIALEAQNSTEAGQHWRRALEMNPENHELQAKLEQLGASSGA
jgi:tetratricopeptide (TPR) repeat protein